MDRKPNAAPSIGQYDSSNRDRSEESAPHCGRRMQRRMMEEAQLDSEPMRSASSPRQASIPQRQPIPTQRRRPPEEFEEEYDPREFRNRTQLPRTTPTPMASNRIQYENRYTSVARAPHDRKLVILISIAVSIVMIVGVLIVILLIGRRNTATTNDAQQTQTVYSNVPNGSDTSLLALSNFMDAWKGKDTNLLLSYVSPAWKSQQSSAVDALSTILGPAVPVGWSVLEEPADVENESKARIRMDLLLNGRYYDYHFTITLINEVGRWFMNPESFRAGALREKTQDGSVTTAIETGMPVKLDPTPTPRPQLKAAHGTVLYYNPSGGRYYHGDMNCGTVEAEFLPMKEFLYEKLESMPFSGLSPCVACGAPPKTHTH